MRGERPMSVEKIQGDNISNWSATKLAVISGGYLDGTSNGRIRQFRVSGLAVSSNVMWTNIATLPSDCSPITSVYMPIVGDDNSTRELYLGIDGSIAGVGLVTGRTYSGTMTYIS